jgi:hypothetical protein
MDNPVDHFFEFSDYKLNKEMLKATQTGSQETFTKFLEICELIIKNELITNHSKTQP